MLGAYVIGVVLVNFGIAAGLAATSDLLRVQDGPATLRAAPSASAEIVMTLDADHKLLALGTDGAWRKVAVFREIGKIGWVEAARLAPYVALAEPAAAETPGEPAPSPGKFILDIRGSPALAYRGYCDVPYGPEAGRASFSGLAPKQYAIAGAAVSCQIRNTDSSGRLTVYLERQEPGHRYAQRLAAASTAVPYNWVRVESFGPDGPANGYAGPVLRRRHHGQGPRFVGKRVTDEPHFVVIAPGSRGAQPPVQLPQ